MRTRLGLAAIAASTAAWVGCGTDTAGDRSSADEGPRTTPARAITEQVSPARLLAGTPRLDSLAKAEFDPGLFDASVPEFPVGNPQRFELIAMGRLVDVHRGPSQPLFPGDDHPAGSVVMEIATNRVFHGEEASGDTVYVRLAVGDLEGLAAAVQPGTPIFVAASTVDESFDQYLDDPYAGVPEGATRYIAGLPFAAVADGGSHTWFPLAQQTTSRPLTALIPRVLAGRAMSAPVPTVRP